MLERVEAESFRLDCPSFADELVGGEAIKGLQSPGVVVGGDEVGEMPNELIVRFVVISLDGRVLDRPVHPLDLSIGPRMIRLGQPMLDPVLTTGAVERVAAEPGGRT